MNFVLKRNVYVWFVFVKLKVIVSMPSCSYKNENQSKDEIIIIIDHLIKEQS